MADELRTESRTIEGIEDAAKNPRDLVMHILTEFEKYESSDWRPGEKATNLIAVLADAGYVIVPKRATAAMVDAYAEHRKRRIESASLPTIEGIWDAMIDAATCAPRERPGRRI